MIKLNNKNITYVALADSNNSLKAPKEIWYADTNNSVKLVYRRKDALIEGEDYEKYHLAKGDRSAYIDTLVTSYSGIIKIAFKSTESTDCAIFGRETSESDFTDRIVLLRYRNNNNGHNVSELYGTSTQNGKWLSADANLNDEEITIDLDNQVMTNKSGNSTQINVGVNITGPSVILFGKRGSWGGTPNRIASSDVAIKKFSVSNQINLIPCKLLKSVPKWLDANGIRRQVGECGMIDLVSGKFYGNVNSVGTFTVENYYERKEWLVGDGTAYIKGIDYNLWANRVELKVGKINVTTIQNNELHYKSTDSNGNVWAVQQNPTITPQFICIFRESGVNVHIVRIDLMPSQATLSFYQNGGYAYCLYNDTENKGGTLNQSSWDTNIIPTIFSYKMSYIREVLPNGSYRSNLIPCTLTMDLPASMDANNIARTKGTSGMWDLVSDRFYGNVANSGTFKAVNLAEGVDYEVHQWLETDLSAANTTYMELPINSVTFSFNRIFERVINSTLFVTTRYSYYVDIVNGSAFTKIWDIPNAQETFRATTPIVIGESISINSTESGLSVNNETMPIYENTNIIIRFRQAVTSSELKSKFKTSTITVDGIERYIPVKLLRSIPAKYDANGIARQAGECGMYDTVNDVFYGNVASSGSFTVEDDS